MITITYVTITYNAEAVLQRTLDSVLHQDYPYIEHLIIDGASTDGTLKIIDEYVARSNTQHPTPNNQHPTSNTQHPSPNTQHHKVLVTSEPDGGIYDAMNKGLRSATGDYICFLNAGDTLPASDTVSKIVEKVVDVNVDVNTQHPSPNTQYSPAVLYGNTDIVDAEGRFLHHRRLQPPEHLTWKSFRRGMLVCHQAFYARTDFAIATPYDLRYRYSADVDWCIRVMKAAAKEDVPLLNLHMTVANYLQEGTTTRHHRASLIERFHVMRRHYGILTTLAMHAWFVLRAVLPSS